MIPSRIKAFIIHLTLSCATISVISFGFINYFYPGVFASLEGVYLAFFTLAIVDITLGPLLTLIVYKSGKKGLTLDLSLIAFCQATALSYGLYIIYDQRPGFLVFYHDSFYSFPASINQAELNYPELYVGPLSQPKVVAAELEGSTEKKFSIVSKSLDEGIAIQSQARLFLPLKDYFNKHNTFIDKKNHQVQQQLSITDNKHYYFEALAGGSSKVVMMDKNTLQLVQTLH